LRVAEKFISRMLREMLPPDRLKVVDVRSMSHVILMAFDGFAMNVHVNRDASCGDDEIEMLCILILGNGLRSTVIERKEKPPKVRQKAKRAEM
jgi:hypothetical protein